MRENIDILLWGRGVDCATYGVFSHYRNEIKIMSNIQFKKLFLINLSSINNLHKNR